MQNGDRHHALLTELSLKETDLCKAFQIASDESHTVSTREALAVIFLPVASNPGLRCSHHSFMIQKCLLNGHFYPSRRAGIKRVNGTMLARDRKTVCRALLWGEAAGQPLCEAEQQHHVKSQTRAF